MPLEVTIKWAHYLDNPDITDLMKNNNLWLVKLLIKISNLSINIIFTIDKHYFLYLIWG